MKYFIILFSLLFASAVCGQQNWTVISHFDIQTAGWAYPVPFFFNEQYGFVLLQSNDSVALYRTTDGGIRWHHVDIFGYDNPNYYPIYLNNLFFDSPGHLYASSSNFDNLYESVDSGLTWKFTTSRYISGLENFYASGGTLYSYDGYFSANNGVSWTLDNKQFSYGA